MISSLALTGCQTIQEPQKIDIPKFPIERPERPMLLPVPKDDTVESIKTLTINMNRLVTHIERLEMYDDLKDAYWEQTTAN